MIKCRICDKESDNFEVYKAISCVDFLPEEIIRHQCDNCEVIFGSEEFINLTQEQLFDLYKKLFETYSDTDFTHREVEVVLSLNPDPEDKILIWGCGNTSSVSYLRNTGLNVFGYEPNIQSNNKFILKNINYDDKYNYIVSNDLIEHLQDPIKQLNIMKDMLEPGGKMAHRTDCYRYVHEYSPFHLYFLIGKSTDIIAQKINMNKVVWHIQDTIIFE
jgi:hypothetical protein